MFNILIWLFPGVQRSRVTRFKTEEDFGPIFTEPPSCLYVSEIAATDFDTPFYPREKWAMQVFICEDIKR